MNFGGKIVELRDQIIESFIFEDQLYFYEGGRLYCLIKDSAKLILENHPHASYITGLGGIWYDDGNNYRYFHTKGEITYKPLKRQSIWLFFNNVYVYSFKNSQSGKYNFAIKDFKTGKTVSHEDSFTSYVSCGEMLFGRKTQAIKCFDLSLNIVWEFEFDRKVDFAYGNLKPFLFQNKIILNIGEAKNGGDGQIVALDKADGSIVWERHFDSEPTFILIDDRIYATESGRMIILDAESGKTIVDQQSGFKNSFKGDSLWSNGRELFMINHQEAIIRVFTLDGRTFIQELQIPEPFSPLQRDHFRSHEDFCYLPLTIRDRCIKGAFYGLLILSKTEDKDHSEIVVEPRIYNQLRIKKTKNGQEFLQVILKDRDIEKILKYGPIIIKEYVNVKGTQVWSDKRRNPRFNGQIVFSANFEDFDSNKIPKIEQMIKETEVWLRTMGVKAGNRKDPIRIKMGPSTNDLLDLD